MRYVSFIYAVLENIRTSLWKSRLLTISIIFFSLVNKKIALFISIRETLGSLNTGKLVRQSSFTYQFFTKDLKSFQECTRTQKTEILKLENHL